jgi:hypothetical protein
MRRVTMFPFMSSCAIVFGRYADRPMDVAAAEDVGAQWAVIGTFVTGCTVGNDDA